MHPIVRTPLVAAALLLCALPATAQKEKTSDDQGVEATGAFREPAFQVYRRAFRALGSAGYGLRAGLIDEGFLMSLPKAPADTVLGHDLLRVIVRLEPLGDSTKVHVTAQAVNGQGDPLPGASNITPGNLAAMVAILSGMEGEKGAPPVPPVAERHGYGYEAAHPVRVGGGLQGGHAAEEAFLRSLRGPSGQPLTFARLGSCCTFQRAGNPPQGRLDAWEVTYEGASAPVVLLLDEYGEESPHAPEGFTAGP
jgi:hypothetical protein